MHFFFHLTNPLVHLPLFPSPPSRLSVSFRAIPEQHCHLASDRQYCSVSVPTGINLKTCCKVVGASVLYPKPILGK